MRDPSFKPPRFFCALYILRLHHKKLCAFASLRLNNYFNVSSSHLKNSRCHAMPFCGCSTQWFSLGRYSSFDLSPCSLAAWKASNPCSTGTRKSCPPCTIMMGAFHLFTKLLGLNFS